jgi:hypothetical protein
LKGGGGYTKNYVYMDSGSRPESFASKNRRILSMQQEICCNVYVKKRNIG